MPVSADFEDFFRESYPAAVTLAQRLLGSRHAAEDVAAEAFARAYVRWRRVGRLPYREAWVLRTATNLGLDQLRRKARAMPARSSAAVDEEVVDDRLYLTQLLQRLPRRQREVVMLRHYAGLQEAEVAAALGIAASSVKTHLNRGLRHLDDAERPS
jgi:RNA polymerase sigma-70 factor (ECF subfamily)